VQLFNMLESPRWNPAVGGLVSTTMDYARFCQMLLNGGTLDGQTGHRPQDAGADGLGYLSATREGRFALMPPGHGLCLGFTVRTHRGVAPFPGSLGPSSFWTAWPVVLLHRSD